MHNVTTSRHIRTSSELMITVPIKNEFVPITELVMSYATRISIVLRALAELRQLKVERGFEDPIGPIERLQTIYRVQWTVLEPFDDVTTSRKAVTRQLHGPQVVLTSHFDSSWEVYFQDLISTGGPLLDLIFSHCEDYEGFSCQDGYEAFSSFIRRHQRRCDFLYVTAPEVTIDDLRYVNRLHSSHASSLPLSLPPIAAEALRSIKRQNTVTQHCDRTRSALRAIHGLWDMRRRLFLGAGGLRHGQGDRTDQQLFDDAVASTLALEPDVYRLRAALEARDKADKRAPEELQAAREWALQIIPGLARTKPPLEAAAANPPRLEIKNGQIEALLRDVQGNILNSFPHKTHGKLALLRCHDRAGLQQLLGWAKANFTSEKASRAVPGLCVNVGLTHHGLKLLELPQDVLEAFPREFREGMEERAGILGDVSHNHPKHWKLPLYPGASERVHLSTIHVALVLLGTQDQIEKELAGLSAYNPNGELVHTLDLKPSGEPERSQPTPPAPLGRDNGAEPSALDVQALGEFVLGYKNNAGALATSTRANGWGELFQNGSFMAMRKMRKDQAALDRYVAQIVEQIVRNDEPTPEEREELHKEVTALIIGRRADGRMLGALQPAHGKPPNSFDFTSDPTGALCPLDSHVRRSNPRDGKAPRIVRRGLAYGPEREGPEAKEEGLLFMAYCANLAGQYELVQRWVNGGNSTGITSKQNDLLCGAPLNTTVARVVSLEGTRAAQLPNAPSTLALPPPAAAFVTLRWGFYLFMPSLTGIERLSSYQPQAAPELAQQAIARGEALIKELEALPAAARTHEWKRLLEEVPEADSPQALTARDVAAAITHAGGAYRFLGEHADKDLEVVVVTKAKVAHKVLSKSDQFSVKEYRTRMNKALADHYLGYDLTSFDEETKISYAQYSTAANAAITGLAQRAAQAEEAYKIAKRILLQPGSLQLDPDGVGDDPAPRNTIAVRDLATAVIGELCHVWLDMPGKGRAKAKQPEEVENTRGWMDAIERLLIASRYCFQAMPVQFLIEQATRNRQCILADYQAIGVPTSVIAQAANSQFRTAGTRRNYGPDAPELSDDERRRLNLTVLLGAVGFAPPAVGAVMRIVDYWIESEKLWQIQRTWCTQRTGLTSAIKEALGKVPAPPTLYRTATAQATPLGEADDKVAVSDGALVIVNLAAVYDDAVASYDQATDPAPESWFFGGPHGGAVGGAPQHGCPGRNAGLLVIHQILAALLERKNLRRERRMLLSYDQG